MRRLLFIILILFLFTFSHPHISRQITTATVAQLPEVYLLFDQLKLTGKVTYEAFAQALAGYNNIACKRKEIVTLIDYSKPSTEERLFVIDMKRKEVLHTSLVSHGRNSGHLYATAFSNDYGSYQSSLGFFLTDHTYQGSNGYSLVLDGLEKGINDRARARAIVMHGAPYSNPSVINSTGRLGRSLGCPALPQSISREIINLIKGGSLIYIYANDPNYFAESPILCESIPLSFG